MQKKYILYSICLASVFALSEPLSAQQQTTATQQASQQQQGRTVKGTVVDETGLAIIGASVKVQGTSTGPSPTSTATSPSKCLQEANWKCRTSATSHRP